MKTLPTGRVRGAIRSCVLLVLLVVATFDAGAQSSSKVRRVGILSAFFGPLSAQSEFGRALGELGYVEGRDVVIEPRYAKGRYDQLPSLAAELVRLRVDVILTIGTIAAKAAKQSTTTIPIVMVVVADPVGSGLVKNLRRPDGNVTGLSRMSTDLIAKRLELLKEAVPRVSRIVAFWSQSQPLHAAYLKALGAAAAQLDLELQAIEVRGAGDIERRFNEISTARPDALFLIGDPMFVDQRTRIVQLAARQRLPTSFSDALPVEIGGFMSYAPSYAESFQRAATYVDKILKGAKPGDLPIEQPTRFELVINLKAAKALGLEIPQSVLLRADRVIR